MGRESTAGLLRFITCGGVDDGKSTLIGRLLYESRLLPGEELDALAARSGVAGGRATELEFARLVDGLTAEREQGITIDVAYRFFATERRRFIVADTPGHEQYTRNMATGASTADAAVVLTDARNGVLTQTRRHTHLLALMGIRQVALAVNKLDLLDYSEEAFSSISERFRVFAKELGIDDVVAIPLSAAAGANVTSPSEHTPWYDGPTLLNWLDNADSAPEADGPARLLVQWVNRPDSEFRGYSGRVLRGELRRGDRVRIAPAGTESSVARIVTMDGDVAEAATGASVTVVLADDVDVSRGDVLAAEADTEVGDAFRAHLVWMGDEELLPGRSYLAKIGARTVGCTAEQPNYRIAMDSMRHEPAKTLGLNDIGVANIHFDTPVAFEKYRTNRDLGSFVLLDRLSNTTLGAGMIDYALRRSANVHWQRLTVDKRARAARNGHRPRVVWFTGLSGSGKSTIADLVERELHGQGAHTFVLDGDNVRRGLNRDLGFTDADRVENIRRVGEMAALMVDAGLIVLVSFISPFHAERELARGLVEPGEFCEVHVDAPLALAEQRDPKGLYAKARGGGLANFTGIDSPYEPPVQPELHLDTSTLSPSEAADRVVEHLRSEGTV